MSIQLDTEPETGRIVLHFVLPASEHPDPVSVVGNFNDWTPGTDLLIDHGDGTIGVNVAVEAGSVIHFRYLASDGHWFDDPDADQHTSEGGVLHVPAPSDPDPDPHSAGSASSGRADADRHPSEPATIPAPASPEAAPTPRTKGRKR